MDRSRHIVLVGLMGTGKSTVGALVAERLGRLLLDSDAMVEARTGRTVREIWLSDGEPAYRVLETDALREALAAPAPVVIAAAGGVVLSEANRLMLRDSGAEVVWLQAAPDELVERVAAQGHRPLLDDDPLGTLRSMEVARRQWYDEVATSTLVTSGRSPDELAAAIYDGSAVVATVNPPQFDSVGAVVTVRVELGERSYPVVVGHGARQQLPELVRSCLGGARRIAVVSQAGLTMADDVMALLDESFGNSVGSGAAATAASGGALRAVQRFDIGDGEHAKTLGTIEWLCSGFAQWGMSRADAVIAVGGGIVTDVAGFAAASYGRGIKVVHVATTLLAMVDAAIGGKTGVNLAEGKNMVGAFWQPSAVVCDLDALATLPEREMKCGAGEMAKYHFLTGDDLLALSLRDRVARCVAIKADVVGGDEREALGSSGGRALLNYGHTLGHALEIATDHYLKHGEAVAIGLMFAAELGQRSERISAARVAEHRAVMDAYGLDVSLPDGMVADELIALMQRDKKALGTLTFILDGPNGLEQLPGIDPLLVKRTLLEMGAS
jgi:5-deoxy-5-amino-3-dehydroquinate synthase